MDEIRILQLGDKDWNEIYSFPGEVKIEHCEAFTETPKAPYDIVFLDRAPLREELEPLYRGTKAYSLFVTEQVKLKGDSKDYLRERKESGSGKLNWRNFCRKMQDFSIQDRMEKNSDCGLLQLPRGFPVQSSGMVIIA